LIADLHCQHLHRMGAIIGVNYRVMLESP